MPKISLAAYSIKVHTRGNPSDLCNLSSIDGTNFYDEFINFISHYSSEDFIEYDEHKIKLNRDSFYTDNNISYGRRFYGIVKGGDTGYSGQIYDSDNTPIFERQSNHTEAYPYYFSLRSGNTGTKALLIHQRFGTSAYAGLLNSLINDFFQRCLPENYILRITPLGNIQVLQQYLAANKLKEIVYLKHAIPNNHLSQLGAFRNMSTSLEIPIAERSASIETKIKFGKGAICSLPRRARDYIINHNAESVGVPELFEIPELQSDLEWDELKLTMLDRNNTPKTFLVNKPDNNARTYLEITDDIEKIDGHPVLNSINEYCKNYELSLIPNL